MEAKPKFIKDFNEPNINYSEKVYKLWVLEALKLNVVSTLPKEDFPMDKHEIGKTDIASLYIPVVKFMRALGFCPVSINIDPLQKFVRYEFKLRSFLTVYNIFLSVLFSAFAIRMVFYFIWVGFNNELHKVLRFQGIHVKREDIPRNLSVVAEFGTRLVPSTFPLFSSLTALGALYSLPNFIKMLNNWPGIQQEFYRAFPHMTDDPFLKLRKYRNGYFVIFPMFAFIATSFVAWILQDCESWKGCIFYAKAIPTAMAVFTLLILVGSHAANIMTFCTLGEIFHQIHVGIRLWSENVGLSGSEYNKILFENLNKWKRIILLAKNQVRLTSKAGAFQHVSAILINFIYLCLGIFSCLQPRLGPTEGNRGYILLLFCAWGFSILTIKAFMCEEILNQEKKIVDRLQRLETYDHVPTTVQINNLIDLITREPAEIRFWNILTLNKPFLVQLIGQVATYLIVLIQFDNMV